MRLLSRSPGEIRFRLKQEAANLWLLFSRPAPKLDRKAPLARFPDPQRAAAELRRTPYAAEVVRLAELVLAHRFPLLGTEIATGAAIRWRRDYRNRVETGTWYFRFIPYLDFARVGDHKFVWELNRHQHLVLLAQAHLLSGREEFFREIVEQLESWMKANPYLRGINWASALEVAFRSLSWVFVYHLAGDRMTPAFRRRFLVELYRHGRYLWHNLSVFFSPNTHLLGEAVALHALGVLFPEFPGAAEWRAAGARTVEEQMLRQVRDDGSHFEQSTYYHVYALDLFLLHYLLGGTPTEYRDRLARMADYLGALVGPQGTLPFFGDDDGGRVFHPYGPREQFGRATLATCAVVLGEARWPFEQEDLYELAAWLLPSQARCPVSGGEPPAQASRLFQQAGMAVMFSGDRHILVDAGPFGGDSAGHSHSDTLSIVVRSAGEDILVDAGAYTYVSDVSLRNWFRGSAAHNTVRIDGADQAAPSGPFRWMGRPETEIRQWLSTPQRDFLDAQCRYRSCTHRRRVMFEKPDLLFVLDEIDGPPGEHAMEQFWHAGAPALRISETCYDIGASVRLAFPPSTTIALEEGGEHGWRSRCFGTRERAPVLVVKRKTTLPARLAALLDFSGCPEPRLSVSEATDGTRLRFASASSGEVWFPLQGVPAVK